MPVMFTVCSSYPFITLPLSKILCRLRQSTSTAKRCQRVSLASWNSKFRWICRVWCRLFKIFSFPSTRDFHLLWYIPLQSIHPTSKAAGISVFKLHHSLGDGYSLMGALLSCLQRADNTSLPLTFPATHREPQADDSKPRMNVTNRVSNILYSVYDGMCDFGWSIAKTGWIADDKTSIRSGSHGVGFHPAVRILTVDLSLDKLKQIKTKLDVTISAVLVGIIFLGARLYMKETGEGSRNTKPTVVVVLNTRDVNGFKSIEEMLNADNKLWGNQIAFLHITLPELTNLNYSNPLDFVFEAQKVIMRKKNSPAVYLSGLFLEMVRKYKGSETAAEYIKGALKNSSLAFTSMIGPIEQMSLANHPIKGLYYMVTGTHLNRDKNA